MPCWSIDFKVKITGLKHFALSTVVALMRELNLWINKIPYRTFSHHFQDIANALLTPERSLKRLVTTFHLTLKFSSIFKNNFLLNIEVTSAESYLKALRKEN